MNKFWVGLFIVGLSASQVSAADKLTFKDPEDSVSYSVGYQIGADFQKNGIAADPEMIAAGARDALKGAEPQVSESEMREKLTDLQKRIAQAKMDQRKEQAARNLEQEKAFFEENGKKKGVVILPSGLQYQVLAEGKGESPKAADTVTVHYRGTLLDGTEFDSSYSRGQPATFEVTKVIKGWTEALQLMKPGAKWKLFIPSRLAYGERGAGARIQPNAALIFEVELISVGKKESK